VRVSIIGTGYVGLVSGACFAEIGHTCICVDVDARKVDRINNGEAPMHEIGLDDMLRRLVPQRLSATTDLRHAVLDSEITFIAVGTPFDGERIDLRYIRVAARQIGAVLRDKRDYHVVVVKSTVVPGTTDEAVRTALEEASGKKAGEDFGLGMNPEFLTEGVAVSDFMQPDRIVLGGIDARSIAVQREVYAPFAATPTIESTCKTAEMIKYVSNSVLATLISFSNEMASVCTALGGIDVAEVMKGVHLARYFTTLTPSGERITAPITSFLWAGCGYGGSCLPKDTKALSAHSAAAGQQMSLLDAVIRINEEQPARMMAILGRHFPQLTGVRVALLGLAFKEDTDDIRESPALPIARMLVDAGASVTAFDPIANTAAAAALPPAVKLAPNLPAAVADACAVMILTRWDEFRQVPELLRAAGREPLLIDGRRFLPRTAAPRYDGIGL
jgi:UDPglucose 6-dehydrogenase/GDP-mannose 6-dehydrogenase